MRGYAIASNAFAKVEVPGGGALTLGNQSGKSEFGRFDIACDGFLTVNSNATVDDLTGSGSVSGVGQLTINGTADYSLVPTSAVISDGATIRLGAGLNQLKDEPLSCLDAVHPYAEVTLTRDYQPGREARPVRKRCPVRIVRRRGDSCRAFRTNREICYNMPR